MDRLVHVAALSELQNFGLGGFITSSLPEIAVEWLLEGVESESLVLLAGETVGTDADDLRKLFYAALSELGVAVPSLTQSALLYRRQLAGEILSGKVSSVDGARRLKDLQEMAEQEFSGGPYVGLGVDAARTHDHFYYYDDAWGLSDRAAASKVHLEVMKACREIVTPGSD